MAFYCLFFFWFFFLFRFSFISPIQFNSSLPVDCSWEMRLSFRFHSISNQQNQVFHLSAVCLLFYLIFYVLYMLWMRHFSTDFPYWSQFDSVEFRLHKTTHNRNETCQTKCSKCINDWEINFNSMEFKTILFNIDVAISWKKQTPQIIQIYLKLDALKNALSKRTSKVWKWRKTK